MSAEGLGSDPSKVAAIRNMPKPSNKEELQRLLGMVNYVAKFLPRISDNCAPLRQLVQDNIEWVWTTEHDRSITEVHESLATAPILRFFNEAKAVTIQCMPQAPAQRRCNKVNQ